MKKKTPEEIRQAVINKNPYKKPFIKVFYQDFFMNASRQFSKDGLIFDPKNAVHVCTLIHNGETREEIADKCFKTLNIERPQEQIFVNRCKEAGHTSMSIGDYVQFEDGEILLCSACGWEKKFTQE
ncbi:MAG: hypothetical protein J7L15_08340 [Clostridiales bacterium]|nr:hypothetical protein [Clostridiales bacterium]